MLAGKVVGDSEGLAKWLGRVTARSISQYNRFASKIIVVVGGLPFNNADIGDLVPDNAQLCLDVAPAGTPDYVVVGTAGASGRLLDACMAAANNKTRFLSQEAFLDDLLFGYDWWCSHPHLLDAACIDCPGLAYVRHRATAYDFTWPVGRSAPVPSSTEVRDEERLKETELHHRGYDVRRLNAAQRWEVLRRIIEHEQMSLRQVVETIALDCRIRQEQRDGERRFFDELAAWHEDLYKLRGVYYDFHELPFAWPNVPGAIH